MHYSLFRLSLASSALLAVSLALASSACKRQETTSYVAPKDGLLRAEASPTPAAPDAHAEGSPLDATVPTPTDRPPLPRVTWKLPAGWQETGPGQMSVASFAIKNEAGQASVSITPLPNLAGQETMIVNMWRQQAGAPELSDAEAAAALSPVEAAGQPARLFEITAVREGKTSRIVTAMLNRADGTWFFKLAGEDAVVSAQKPTFIDFLKGVEFGDKGQTAPAQAGAALPEMGAPAPAGSAEPSTAIPLPTGWRVLPAGQMQVAKFAVPDQGNAKAEVAVSMFTSDTGGTNSNVARWRRQLGLPDVSDAELSALPQPLDATLPGALVADLQNDKKGMIGAIVPREGSWWFYKLMGDTEAVSAARESFLTLVKTPPKS